MRALVKREAGRWLGINAEQVNGGRNESWGSV